MPHGAHTGPRMRGSCSTCPGSMQHPLWDLPPSPHAGPTRVVTIVPCGACSQDCLERVPQEPGAACGEEGSPCWYHVQCGSYSMAPTPGSPGWVLCEAWVLDQLEQVPCVAQSQTGQTGLIQYVGGEGGSIGLIWPAEPALHYSYGPWTSLI